MLATVAGVDDIDVADVVIVVAIIVVMMAITMVVLLVVVMLMAEALMLLEFAPRVRDRHRTVEMKGSVTLSARAE